MADQIDINVLPPPLPDEESPFLGHAIVKGRFRFLSVSQVVQFDVRQEGGCPRRWAFAKLFGKKEEVGPNDPRTRGKKYAREVELYLKYNYDALSPIMRAGKHLLPKPGSDLEVEEPLAGSQEATLAAIAMRDRVLSGDRLSDEEIDKIARLSACGIPFIGAADYAHRRGVYVTAGGVLVDEPYPDVTAECGDHKTTARINERTTRPRKKGGQPTILPGYAKTPEQIGAHPQMLGYGIWQHNKHPHLKYIRLSHNYYQTKDGYAADKRSILVTVDEIRARWQATVVPVVREMIDVACSVRPEDTPFNLKACKSFGKECVHSEYCDRPAKSFHEVVTDLFDEKGTPEMALSLDDLFPSAQPTVQAVSPPPLVVVPEQSDEERERLILEEKARLMAQTATTAPPLVQRHPLDGIEGYTVGQPCNGRGYYQNSNGHGFIDVEPGHSCSVCAQVPAQHTMTSVNPADAPRVDHVATADPLTPEAIAEITNPELRALAEAHARACAERAEAEKAARASEKPKTGCPGIGQTVPLTDNEKRSRKKKCPGCGKELKFAGKDFTHDFSAFVVPKHRMPENAQPVAPAAPPPLPTPPALASAPAAPPALASAPAAPPALASAPAAPPALPVAVPSAAQVKLDALVVAWEALLHELRNLVK